MEGEKSVRKSELPPFSGAKLHSHSRSHAERRELELTFAPKNGDNSDLKLKLKRRQHRTTPKKRDFISNNLSAYL